MIIDADAGDENVEPAEILDGLLHHRLARFPARDIGGESEKLAPAELILEARDPLGVAIDRHDRRAFIEVTPDDGLPDAAGRADDQCYLTV